MKFDDFLEIFSKHGSFHIFCDSFFISFLSLIVIMIEKDIENPPI